MPSPTRPSKKKKRTSAKICSMEKEEEGASKIQKEENLVVDEDRISDLPDPLLCSIISFLPLKEALAASLVSRRWRFLWRNLTHLGIDYSSCMPMMVSSCNREERIREVTRVVWSQQNKVIASQIYFSEKEWPDILEEKKSWISFLRDEKRLEKLVIEFLARPVVSFWPPRFYHGVNLHELEIILDYIWDASPFEGCLNLKTLKLNSVKISDEILVEIVKKCGNLVNLFLIRCVGLKHIGIEHKTMNCIGIDGLRLKSLELISERLTVLSISSFSCSSLDVRCPKLNELRIDKCSSDFLERFSGLVGSEINWGCLKVKTLRSNFNLDNWYHLILIRFILRSWTCLQQLYIINEGYEGEPYHQVPYPDADFWEGEWTEVIVHHLKVVQIEGFTCRQKEMSFVSHLIKNAEVLEKLIIQFDHPCVNRIENVKRELLSLQRGSHNVSFIFDVQIPKKKESESASASK